MSEKSWSEWDAVLRDPDLGPHFSEFIKGDDLDESIKQAGVGALGVREEGGGSSWHGYDPCYKIIPTLVTAIRVLREALSLNTYTLNPINRVDPAKLPPESKQVGCPFCGKDMSAGGVCWCLEERK